MESDRTSQPFEKPFLERIANLNPRERAAAIAREAFLDPEFFARLYLAPYMRLRTPEFHRIVFRWQHRMATAHAQLDRRAGLRFALAAPRGYGKSTLVSLILLLHDIAFRNERYILLISATELQARQRIRTIRNELLKNDRLRAALPPIESATVSAIVANGVRIEAFGAGSEMRGISQAAWRPSKIVLDDAESSAAAESSRRRAHIADWFREVVEHLGDRYTHLLAIGTVLHHDGLLAQLLARPDFEALRLRSIESFADDDALWHRWRAILTDLSVEDRRIAARRFFEERREEMLAGAKVLWPEKEDYETLLAQLTVQGRRAFYREKQNTPLGPEDALFAPEAALRGFVVGDELRIGLGAGDSFALRRAMPWRGAQRFGYLDAAMGKARRSGRGDFAALAVVSAFADGTLFLEDLWVRRAAPSEQVAQLFARHEAAPFTRLAIEGTAFQELLTIPIEAERERRRSLRQRADLPLQTVNPRQKKETRIAALEPLLANGSLVLSAALPEEFWAELAAFPRTEHDDALDAAAGAVELARIHGFGAATEAILTADVDGVRDNRRRGP